MLTISRRIKWRYWGLFVGIRICAVLNNFKPFRTNKNSTSSWLEFIGIFSNLLESIPWNRPYKKNRWTTDNRQLNRFLFRLTGAVQFLTANKWPHQQSIHVDSVTDSFICIHLLASNITIKLKTTFSMNSYCASDDRSIWAIHCRSTEWMKFLIETNR